MVQVKTRLFLAVATVLCVLAAAGTAAAEEINIFSINPSGRSIFASLGSISLATSALTMTCPLTLNGELERYLQLDAEVLFGTVTSGTPGRCSSGSIAIETTTPWLLTYRSSLGTLPSLTGVLFTVRNASFLVTLSIFGFTARCKYTGEFGALLTLTGRGPLTTGLISLLAREQSYTLDNSLDTSGLCPAAETVSVSGTVGLSESRTLQQLALGFRATPAAHNFGNAGGEREFTFTNRSNAAITVTRIELEYGNRGFRLAANECMEMDGRSKTFLRDQICRARIRFTSGGLFAGWAGDVLLVSSGAGGTVVEGRVGVLGR